MGKYGNVAEIAVRLAVGQNEIAPRTAWHRAARKIFPESVASQEKACPRDAFLGLCSAGAVEGVPAGFYTRSIKNKQYVLRALHALRTEPELLSDRQRLWSIATGGQKKRHNGQMDVLRALWAAGHISEQASIPVINADANPENADWLKFGGREQ